jgi:N utilization substance protein A
VVEAAGDVLHRLQTQADMVAFAEAEAKTTAHITEILGKKAENRPITPEEYTALGQFVDRVERRTIERQRADDKASAEKLAEARAGVPDVAFTQPLEVLGIPEHVFNILTEAEYRTAGDLLLAMRLDPDKVLGLPGVGPKAMKAIEKAVAEATFEAPVTEQPVAEVAEAVAEAVAPVETATQVAAEPEAAVEAPKAEGAVEVPVVAESEDSASTSFEELFKLRPEIVAPVVDDDDELKKGKKKGKKSVEYQFDEARGEVVGRKKHKRGDGTWEEDV